MRRSNCARFATVSESSLSIASCSFSSASINSILKLFSGIIGAGSIYIVACDPLVPRTTEFGGSSPFRPALIGIHRRSRRITTCARSAAPHAYMSRDHLSACFWSSAALSSFSARISPSDSDAVLRMSPSTTLIFSRIAVEISSGEFSARMRSAKSSARGDPKSTSRSCNRTVASTDVATAPITSGCSVTPSLSTASNALRISITPTNKSSGSTPG
mmetsp:Transcript_2907/g.8671  ORF Transcript_2907/g.8671 Transcript_2907/m.8671 type:complete len:216 (+) Transcript_2907:2220-2867(+)